MINAIVTLYNPDSSVIEHVKGFANQTDRVILCDNSREDHAEMFSDIPGVIYTSEHKNLGLSAAFNKVLRDEGYHWQDKDIIIFFDQDSSIKDGHIQKLVNEYKRLVSKKIKVGCLGPAFYNLSSHQLFPQKKYRKIDNKTYYTDVILTSSLLTQYKTLKRIGFWNESLFLDMSDWDLCWRMVANKYKVCYTENLIFYHRLGMDEVSFGILKAKEAVPVREYYETRDCLKLLTRNYTPFKYKIRFIAQVTLRPILHLMLLQDKKKRLFYIYKGIGDYFCGIQGEIDEGK